MARGRQHLSLIMDDPPRHKVGWSLRKCPVMSALTERVLSLRLPETVIRQHLQEVRQHVLAQSRSIKEPNLKRFTRATWRLFRGLRRPLFLMAFAVRPGGARPVSHSTALPRLGRGHRKRIRSRAGDVRFEIAIASGMLFDGFRDPEHRAMVCGLNAQSPGCATAHLRTRVDPPGGTSVLGDQQLLPGTVSGDRRPPVPAPRALTILTRREIAARSGILRGSQGRSFEFEGRRLSDASPASRSARPSWWKTLGRALYRRPELPDFYVPLHALR